MSETENTEAVEVVDYSAKALEEVETGVNNIDFGVFMTMFTMVIGATIGVTVGITALRKGFGWVIGFIKGL